MSGTAWLNHPHGSICTYELWGLSLEDGRSEEQEGTGFFRFFHQVFAASAVDWRLVVVFCLDGSGGTDRGP